MTNNFDTSSSGINIEATVEWDYGLARINWDENIKRIDNGQYKGKFVYISYGELPEDIDMQPSPRQKGKLIIAFLKEFDYLTRSELHDMAQEDIVEELEANFYPKDLERFYENHNIEMNNDWVKISIHGYNQGDYAEVFVNAKAYKELTGAKFNENELNKWFTHLFYDSPQYVCVEINGEEYEDEYAHGNYAEYNSEENYDKARFIAQILRQTASDDSLNAETFKKELEALLSDEVQTPSGW